MKLRTLIIDDEPIALEKLATYVTKEPSLELAARCQSAFQAMEFLASGHDVDLIITDINMPDLDGLEFIKALPEPPAVIFITAHPQYAVDSYKVSAVDYLLKPYSFADFHRAVSKAQGHLRARTADRGAEPATDGSIFIKTDYRYVRVSTADIRYVKGYGEYLQIFVDGAAAPLLTLSSFSAIRERLPGCFLQVHRSYIVNMNHVRQIERNRIIMDPDCIIPVGESYRPAFLQYLSSHTIGPSAR